MRAYLVLLLGLIVIPAFARDNGQYANSPLKAWFDQLASGKGLCCSYADGRTVNDPDWGIGVPDLITLTDMRKGYSFNDASGKVPQSLYYVIIDGKKVWVPPSAVVSEPNKFGRAVVWPYNDGAGNPQIRCFMPGVEV